MRFLTVLTSICYLFFFGCSTIMIAAPMGVAQTPFLKNMLQNEPSESQNKPEKKSNSNQKSKKKQSLKKRIPHVVYFVIEVICQCGGKKVLNFMLPKHIRKAEIAGFLQFVDALSFTMGFLMFYGGIHMILLKKEMLLMRSKSLLASLSSWIHESNPTKISTNNPEHPDQLAQESDESETSLGIQRNPNSKAAFFWAPPCFIK